MNLSDKRKLVKKLIDQLDQKRLDALITLLEEPADNIFVHEDDRAQVEYRSKKDNPATSEAEKEIQAALQKKAVIEMVHAMDDKYVAALEMLLGEPMDEYEISEEDWAEVERRSEEDRLGKVKMIPAWESLERIKAELLRKSGKKKK